MHIHYLYIQVCKTWLRMIFLVEKRRLYIFTASNKFLTLLQLLFSCSSNSLLRRFLVELPRGQGRLSPEPSARVRM